MNSISILTFRLGDGNAQHLKTWCDSVACPPQEILSNIEELDEATLFGNTSCVCGRVSKINGRARAAAVGEIPIGAIRCFDNGLKRLAAASSKNNTIVLCFVDF